MLALDSSTAAWLRLHLTPGVGNVTARRLLAAFSLPENIFEQSFASLKSAASSAQAQALLNEPEGFASACATLAAWLQTPQQRVLTVADKDYPQCLLQMPDPPLMLYVHCADGAWWQSWCGLEQTPLLAMVGSRNPTPQGEKNAKDFAMAMAAQGWGIVSGLALGIDAAAHRATLAAKGKTIAVVGTGLDRVYPKQHHELAHAIVQGGGALVSEFPLGTGPLATNFPKRNRIIAGLSAGTLVVEANVQSGSLITARLAMEQNKEVFAIPGSIHAPQYKGCHALIKQGAKLVECADDISSELPALAYLPIEPEITATASNASVDASDTQTLVLQRMGFDPVTLDVLLQRCALDAATVQIQLLELEMQAQVQRLHGGLYQRIGKS